MGDVKFKEGDRVVIARKPEPEYASEWVSEMFSLVGTGGVIIEVHGLHDVWAEVRCDDDGNEWSFRGDQLDLATEVEIPVPGAPAGWYTKGSKLVVKAAPEETVWPRATVLREAEKLCCGDRNAQYGSPTQDFKRIAALWSILFDREFKAHEVATALCCVKLSRIKHSPAKRDSWVDLAGYAACGQECTEEEK